MVHDAREESAGPRLVRPYALTSGRTESTVALPIEATLDVQPSARTATWPEGDLSGRIIELCGAAQSVADGVSNAASSVGAGLTGAVGAGAAKGRGGVHTLLDSAHDKREDLADALADLAESIVGKR